MSWSFQIFSARPLEETNAVVSELGLLMIDFDDVGFPEIMEVSAAADFYSTEFVREEIEERFSKPSNESLRLAKDFVDRVGAASSVVEVGRFPLKTNPAGVAILTFLVERLKPCFVHARDTFQLDSEILMELSKHKSMSLEGGQGTDEFEDEEHEESERELTALEMLRGSMLEILEIASENPSIRSEVEKRLTRTHVRIRNFLGNLVNRAPLHTEDPTQWPAERQAEFNGACALVEEMKKLIR